ncbi:regulator [Streptomyces sp. NPDC056405]|uniref:regulator n=1 Tax=Streptomyces sp. NPDC056405 TaxID=3345811 RepID=UPI0035D53D6C
MTTPFTAAEIRTAVEALTSRSLIRLITEIDDNGAIPPRRLATTLPDLSTHHLRAATETARTHGLVRTAPGVGLELTPCGEELADVYDAAARWSRRHACPASVCEFTHRVRHVLDLLAPETSGESTQGPACPSAAHRPGATPEAELDGPRALLLQWLVENPQLTCLSTSEPLA